MSPNELFLIGARFDDVTLRFDGIDNRFDSLTQTLTDGFKKIEDKIDSMDARTGSLEQSRSTLYGIGKGIGIVVSAIVCIAGLFMYMG